LQALNYQFALRLNWLPGLSVEQIEAALRARRESDPARLLIKSPIGMLPARLWEKLAMAAGISRDLRCADLSRSARHLLVQQLIRTELKVTGKSLNKDEFVTCGGVRLGDVNFQTMESRLCPGLYFAGELLDIDGVTGGYNFQAAWTTGWLAGRGMAGDPGR
jgi:predicted Rossmann fold flavoprotein